MYCCWCLVFCSTCSRSSHGLFDAGAMSDTVVWYPIHVIGQPIANCRFDSGYWCSAPSSARYWPEEYLVAPSRASRYLWISSRMPPSQKNFCSRLLSCESPSLVRLVGGREGGAVGNTQVLRVIGSFLSVRSSPCVG